MSRKNKVRMKKITRTESISERMDYYKKLLNGDIPKYFYDYYAHSREYLSMVVDYGLHVGRKIGN